MVLNIHDSVLGNQEEIVLTKVNLVTTHAWLILFSFTFAASSLVQLFTWL